MRTPASTEREIILREVKEAENALFDIACVLKCRAIVDPTETLGDRIRHLGMIAVMQSANLQQLRSREAAREVDKNLDELENFFRGEN